MFDGVEDREKSVGRDNVPAPAGKGDCSVSRWLRCQTACRFPPTIATVEHISKMIDKLAEPGARSLLLYYYFVKNIKQSIQLDNEKNAFIDKYVWNDHARISMQ